MVVKICVAERTVAVEIGNEQTKLSHPDAISRSPWGIRLPGEHLSSIEADPLAIHLSGTTCEVFEWLVPLHLSVFFGGVLELRSAVFQQAENDLSKFVCYGRG